MASKASRGRSSYLEPPGRMASFSLPETESLPVVAGAQPDSPTRLRSTESSPASVTKARVSSARKSAPLRSHARSSETLRLRRKSLRPQDPRIGFITLRRAEFFPQEKYPNLARLWTSMEARESMKKTAPPPA